MRIRKRSAATSSGKPELPERRSDGACQPNPSLHDSRSSFITPASIIMQDHLLLAGSDYSSNHRPSKKRLLAESVAFEKKPHTIVPGGVASCEDHDKGLITRMGDGNPKATSGLDAQQNEVRHCHNTHDGGDNHAKGCKERLGPSATSWRKRNKLSEACKKARHSITSCNGSTLPAENVNTTAADPAMVDASECSRKVRPLQLILRNDLYSSAAPILPLPLCPTNNSSTMPGTLLPLSRRFEKALPSALTKMPPRLSSSAGSSPIRQMMDVKSHDEIRNEDTGRCSQNSGSDPICLLEDRAEFNSVPRRLVSSWQGNRRPRSMHIQVGRGSPGSVGLATASVNVVFSDNKTQKGDPPEQTKKKPKHTRRKPLNILVSGASIPARGPPPTPCSTSIANRELRKQDVSAARKLDSVTQKLKNDPFGPLTCPTIYCDALPNSTKRVGSLPAAESPVAKRAVTLATCSPYEPSVLSAAVSDHKLENDSTQCRRKDGRRWRCKAQVIKAGAPFCHYHTLKMREKHAASVVRRLSKKLHEDVKILVNHADLSRNSNKGSCKRRTLLKSLPSRRGVHDGYGRGLKGAEVNEDREADGKEEANITEEEEQKIHARKPQMQESLTLRRRWRKKCKPCIRRLHDIRDRAMPPAADGLDLLNTCKEDTSDISPVRSWSPLPRCVLNTDPDEWRSDLP